ncbi:DUF2493 domain-containing protein [Sorangium sp. So ce388]|uniref:DUF2493 domain-containing protein n=1 Tax=Sorangium sp. So ce388 TaxID=3133309 RepID=UPI003F5BA664
MPDASNDHPLAFPPVGGPARVRVVICGSRDWVDRGTIRAWVAKLPPDAEAAHGAARGADTIGGEEAEARGLRVLRYPADWQKHGNAAGPIRNRQMLDAFRPTVVFAFTDRLIRGGRLTGTGDCVAAAIERGIRCTIVPSGGT